MDYEQGAHDGIQEAEHQDLADAIHNQDGDLDTEDGQDLLVRCPFHLFFFKRERELSLILA